MYESIKLPNTRYQGSKKKIIKAITIRDKIENFCVAPLCKRAERKAILKSSLLTDIYSFKNKLIF